MPDGGQGGQLMQADSQIFQFHTDQRMKPSDQKGSYGVSSEMIYGILA